MKMKLSLRLQSTLLPILTGLLPIIVLWNNNLGQMKSRIVLLPLLFTLVYLLAVMAIWLLITRSLRKTALLSTMTSILTFSFGHLYNLLQNNSIFGISIGFVKFFVVYVILFLIFSFLIIRKINFPDFIFPLFNSILAVLIIFNLFSITSYEIRLSKSNKVEQVETKPISDVHSGSKPDIYYIVLDAYTRDDVLSEVIGYDNSAFLQALRDRGFYIPPCAFSNYSATMLTVPSVLNYDYLQNARSTDNPDEDMPENLDLLLNNKIRYYFKNFDYQFVTGRGFTSAMDINDSDLYLNYFQDIGGIDDLDQKRFTNLYLNTTIYRIVSELYKNNPENFSFLPYWLSVTRESDPYLQEASFWYYQNNYMFDSLEKIPEKPGNYLVYAHIIAPHGPYVFRSDGSFRYPLDTQDEKILYADAITYLNRRILEIVDTLQSNSTTQPVIIIQGDHGIHKLTSGLDKNKILSAYYLPGVLQVEPYPTITPVNDFRLVIKNYFDHSIELLPDILYVKWADNDLPVSSSCDLQP